MFLNWLALRGLSRNVLGPWTSSYRSGEALARGLRTGARYGPSRRYSRLGVAAVGLLGGSIYLEWPPKVYADELDRPSQMKERSPTPLSTLIRTYGVYSMCSIPALIDWAPSILSFISSIPVVRQITEAFVRQTFFAQFVGGDTAEDCMPLLEQLRAENKGCLFAYSVEVDEEEAAGQTHGKTTVPVHKRIVDEMIHSIDVAANFENQYIADKSSPEGRRTWVAVKLTAMTPDAQALINFSEYLVKARSPLSPPVAFPGCPRSTDMDALIVGKVIPGSPLREQDVADLKELYQDLARICVYAQERGVRLIVDAEYSWYQPAIDAVTLSLMRQFNKLPSRLSTSRAPSPVQPLVYATFQAYLRRTPEYLLQSLKDAEAGNYSIGVKLVRGAYHPHEVAAHPASASSSTTRPPISPSAPHTLSISPEPLPPVWLTKPETDICYNSMVKVLVGAIKRDMDTRKKRGGIPGVGVLFGSHNWESCDLILEELVRQGLASKTIERDGRGVIVIGDELGERVTMAQLYGMNDALGNSIVDRTRSSFPFLIKYIPYGALSEVMPYLSRRAIENKSVLSNGQAAEERQRAWAEIRARILG